MGAAIRLWETDILREFVAANSVRVPSGAVRHHAFHYTDVSVVGPARYAAAGIGAADTDIVHAIPLCIQVLQGKLQDNPYKITRPVALILLAHYVGDIHQPLHVGAAYFRNGKMDKIYGRDTPASHPL